MARRGGMLSLDFSAFEELAEELDKAGFELKEVFDDVLTQAAETVQDDTVDAVASSNLPAHGKYSKGKTLESINRNPKVNWSGSIGEVGLGFDKSKAGAGGWLITGTPKMRPDYALQDIYDRKKYSNELRKDMMEQFMNWLNGYMG